MGASSIYEIDFTANRPYYDPDYGRKDVQKTVEVSSCRLDTFCNEQRIIPDAIFMDVQEAELVVLKSMSELLKKVKYIVFEASNTSTYKGGCCYNEIDSFLRDKGFTYRSDNGDNGDNGFRYRSDNMPESQKNNFWGFCDFLYINKDVL